VLVPRLPSLRRIRQSRFLTQQELAQRAGLSIVTVARLEALRTEARFATVRRLAHALKVKPEDLVAGLEQ
jgi:predicted transcriptional regulator